MRKNWMLGLGAAVAVLVGGCASSGSGEAGAVVRFEPAVGGAGVSVVELLRPREGVAEYRKWEKEVMEEEGVEVLRVETVAVGEGQWLVVSEVRGGAKPGARGSERVRLEAGKLVLVGTEDGVEKVMVAFDPPLDLGLEKGGEASLAAVKSGMTVRNVGASGKVKASGSATNVVTIAEWVRVRMPGAAEEGIGAAHVLSEFQADLGTTKVRTVTDQWVSPEMGVLARRRSERTSVLGVQVRAIDEAWYRVLPSP